MSINSWFRRSASQADSALLTVTDAARQHVLGVLQRHNIPQDVAARLRLVAGDLDISMGAIEPSDATFSYQGRVVLLLDAQTAQALSGRTIDVRGAKLVLCPSTGEWNF
jgi:hypothetical protein